MSVYGYCRVSTAGQASNNSMADQERKISGVAMYHGLDLDEVVSEVVSGVDFEFAQRPAAGALLGRLKKGDMLVVAYLDRAFRSVRDALDTAQKFREAGISLVVADMGAEPVTGDGVGRMFFGMLALVAEFEASRLREDTLVGRKAKKVKGGHIGGQAPFGYRVEGVGKGAVLVEDSAQQHALKWIREQGAAGVASRKIAQGVAEHFSLKVSHVTVCNIVKESRN